MTRRVCALAREAGFRSRGGEVVTIDRGPHHSGVKAVYLVDPDGYHVELYCRKKA